MPGMRDNPAAEKRNHRNMKYSHNVALRFTHLNYRRIHQTLRVTPAMQAGLADHVWELEELVGLMN